MLKSANILRSRLFRPNWYRIAPPINRSFHTSKPRFIDPYASLGVSKDASEKEIKKKYYELAKKYHPDVNKEAGADKKFQDIQNSYEILSDADKRRQYDQFGSSAFNGQAGSGPSGYPGGQPGQGFGGGFGFDPFGGGGNFGNFEDIFSAFTGQRSNRGQRARQVEVYKGEDIEVLVQLSLEEAASGTTKKVRYSVIDECKTCNGSGLKEGAKPQTCGHCHGTGTAMHVIQGGFQMASTCPTCGGSGEVVSKSSECSSCHGEGVKHDIKTYDAVIPPGVRDGSRLMERNLGDSPGIRKSAMIRTQKGDLIVRIKLKAHPLFKRYNNDLLYEAHLPVTTAILGGKVQIPTLQGAKLKINIPSGTKHGETIVVPNQGMPINSRSNGDLKVKILIDPFKPSNETQTVLLEALADSIGDKDARRKYKPLHEVEETDNNEASTDAAAPKEGLFRKLIKKVLPKD